MRRRIASTLGGLVLLTSAAGVAGITKGPYLQDVRADRITVAAETDVPQACRVEWGPAFGQSTDLNADGLHHEGVISGLAPSSCQDYRLVCGQDVSPQGSFCTAGLPGEPFSFVVFGDTRSNHADHQAVIDAIQAEGVDFFVNTGDLVADGQNEADWVPFFEIEAGLLRDVPIYPVIGNHDTDDAAADIYLRLFAPPSASSGSERYYSFRYANTAFIVLDNKSSVLLGPDAVLPNEQGDWFLAELQAAAADPGVDHLLVLLHENMYSVKDGRSGDGYIRQWRQVMQANGVDLVLAGHDHYYCRGEADNGLPFVVTGGGGAGLYDVKSDYRTEGDPVAAYVWDLQCPVTCWFTVHYAKKIHHYLRIDVAGGQLSACTKDVNGVAFDCFSFGDDPVDGGDGGQDGGLDGGLDGGGGDPADADPQADAGADSGPDEDPGCGCDGEPLSPVCGEDGLTYDNLCEMDCAQVGLAHQGPCDAPDGGLDGGDDGRCGCDAVPAGPVCGDDGVTYRNACELECAGVGLAQPGECPGDPGGCECPDEDDPVCGVDGVTYRNECLMACMDVEGLHPGRCGSRSDCSCGAGSRPLSLGLGVLLIGLLLIARRRAA